MPKRKDTNAPFWKMLRKAEADIIAYALEQGGTITKAAHLLGISVNYLSERTRELGVPAPNKTKELPSRARRAERPVLQAISGGLEQATAVPEPPLPDPSEPEPDDDDFDDEDDPEDDDVGDEAEDDAENGEDEDEDEDDQAEA